ncbi:endonuclease V-like [Chenopodium quinoa]|uniref:endonuclease V-like n=1 Tax=Chenopodium quinoa TaxID=63459 RepID=UPI000B78CCA8|nr:endonuclease V-like [Chenopodium quinoa]
MYQVCFTEGMEQSSSSSSNHQHHWIEVQDELKKKLIKEDGFSWEIPSSSSSVELEMGDGGERKEELKYVGGVDISFLKEDPSVACGTLVVLELDSLNVVYDDFSVAKLHIPYVPGFLAFREAPILLKLLDKMKKNAHSFYPQLLMVDGNGILHPRGFGLACHLGVMADLPTIGIGKNLHHVEGLNHSEVRDLFKTGDYNETVYLNGNSGQTLGVAMRSTLGALKPIYISIGHRISLTTAMKVVKLTCKYRVPEPIRQADLRSREYLRKQTSLTKTPCDHPSEG